MDDGKMLPNAATPDNVAGSTKAKSSATWSRTGGVINMLYPEKLLLLLVAFHQLVCIA